MASSQARRLRKSMTPQEVRLWGHLRQFRRRGYHFRRQAPIGSFVVDFACLRHHLIVEVDGSQHGNYGRAKADEIRDNELGADGFRVLRFWNADVDRNIDGVLHAIRAAVEPERTPPTMLRMVPPPRSGEG